MPVAARIQAVKAFFRGLVSVTLTTFRGRLDLRIVGLKLPLKTKVGQWQVLRHGLFQMSAQVWQKNNRKTRDDAMQSSGRLQASEAVLSLSEMVKNKESIKALLVVCYFTRLHKKAEEPSIFVVQYTLNEGIAILLGGN